MSEGIKNDDDKTQLELIPPDATEGIGKVLTFGAKKYAPYNWAKGINYSRIIGAIKRHLLAIERKEDIDPESGLLHADHIACNVAFLQTYMRHSYQYAEFDDRYEFNEKQIYDDDSGEFKVVETISGVCHIYRKRDRVYLWHDLSLHTGCGNEKGTTVLIGEKGYYKSVESAKKTLQKYRRGSVKREEFEIDGTTSQGFFVYRTGSKEYLWRNLGLHSTCYSVQGVNNRKKIGEAGYYESREKAEKVLQEYKELRDDCLLES